MVTQNVNMYTKAEQLGTRKIFYPTPSPLAHVPPLTVGLYVTDTVKYVKPDSVPESSFSPPNNFDYIKMLDIT